MTEIPKAPTAEQVGDLVRGSRPPIRIVGSQSGSVRYAIPPGGASFFDSRRRTPNGLEFVSQDGQSRGLASIIEVSEEAAAGIDEVRDAALKEIGITPIH